MRPVVVLGGYGHLGRLCVAQTVAHTRAPVVVAGRNTQRAQSLALRHEGRATGTYADARDARTIARTLDDAAALLVCCGGEIGAALDVAIERRVPVIVPGSALIDDPATRSIAERAWMAGTPVVLHAGAVPGLPGVLAEALVRRFAALQELRIATTGPWLETRSAAQDLEALRCRRREPAGRWWPQRQRFPDPVGPLGVRPAISADLVGFGAAHLVERIRYMEPLRSTLGRGIERLLRGHHDPAFCAVAEARVQAGRSEADARMELRARSPLDAAAAVACALTGAAISGQLPAGLLTPREARAPQTLLAELEKLGIRVSA